MNKSALVFLVAAALVSATSGASSQSSVVDLSKPMTGKSRYAVEFSSGEPIDLGVIVTQEEEPPHQMIGGAGVAAGSASALHGTLQRQSQSASGTPATLNHIHGPGCGDNHYGAISCVTGAPKRIYVRDYVRRDGIAVRSHYRSRR